MKQGIFVYSKAFRRRSRFRGIFELLEKVVKYPINIGYYDSAYIEDPHT